MRTLLCSKKAHCDPPIVILPSDTTINPYNPWSVSSDGTNWVVAYRNLDTAAGIFTIDGARVAPDGTLLDLGGRRLRRDFWNSAPTDADLAFAGDEYLLVWTELDVTGGWVVKGQRLTLALDPIGGPFQVNLMGRSSPKVPRVATDGNAFLVTWFEDRFRGFAQVFGARVSHTGQVLDPQGIAITGFADYTQFTPTVAWDGTNYFVVYNFDPTLGNEDIYATRVSPAGEVLDPAGVPVKVGPANQSQPAVDSGVADGVQVVWMDAQAGGPNPEDEGAHLGFLPPLVAGGALAAYNPKLAMGAGGLTLIAAAVLKKGASWWIIGVVIFAMGFLLYWNDRNAEKQS